MNTASKVLPIRQKTVRHVREFKQEQLLKPVRMRLKLLGTLTSSISLILNDIFMYLTLFINVA